ncbi:MAG TPA: hypothetical protein VMG12_32450 [Polyangiaceae bacterium]|nr:hypothetical protein [Polyangiaceae bacterium]
MSQLRHWGDVAMQGRMTQVELGASFTTPAPAPGRRAHISPAGRQRTTCTARGGPPH